MLKCSRKKSTNALGFVFFNKTKNFRARGFTLVELLLVIAIIGILSGIVLTSMSGTRERANDARRISDIKQIQLALELYYDVHSKYPMEDLYYDPKPLEGLLKISYDPSGTAVKYKYWWEAIGGQNYHLGAVLKQYNKLLAEDDDATDGFDGNSGDCAGGAGDDRCYDLTP